MSRSLERLIGIDSEIRRGTYPSVLKLCEMFEVKPRTIYDDIRKLKENFGLDIAYDRFKEGYFNSDKSKTLPSFDLTETEMTGLAISGGMVASQAGFLKPELDTGIEKIRSRVSQTVEEAARNTCDQVQNVPVALPVVSRRVFTEVRKAIKKQERIELSYYAASTDKTTTRVVEPYRILQHQGAWYLLANCTLREDLRLFAIHRIADLNTLTDQRFEKNKDLDIDQWLSKAFQIERQGEEWKVSILFRKEAAPYIRERVWKEGQVLEEKSDGSVILTFPALSLDEVKRWVMYYGSNAVVLRPRPLVEMIENELKSALNNYSAAVSHKEGKNGSEEIEGESFKLA